MKNLSARILVVSLAVSAMGVAGVRANPDEMQAPAGNAEGGRAVDQIREPAAPVVAEHGRPAAADAAPRVTAGDAQQPAVNGQVRAAADWALDSAGAGSVTIQPGANRAVTLTASYGQLSGPAREQVDRIVASAGAGTGMGAVLQSVVSDPNRQFTLTLAPTAQPGQFRITEAHNTPLSDSTGVNRAVSFAAVQPPAGQAAQGVVAAQPLANGGVMLTMRANQLTPAAREQLEVRAADERAPVADRDAATAVLTAAPGAIVTIAVSATDHRIAGAPSVVSPPAPAGPAAAVPPPMESLPQAVAATRTPRTAASSSLLANAPSISPQALQLLGSSLNDLRPVIFSQSMPSQPTSRYLNSRNVGGEFARLLSAAAERPHQQGNPVSIYTQVTNRLDASGYVGATKKFDEPPPGTTARLREAWSLLNQVR